MFELLAPLEEQKASGAESRQSECRWFGNEGTDRERWKHRVGCGSRRRGYINLNQLRLAEVHTGSLRVEIGRKLSVIEPSDYLHCVNAGWTTHLDSSTIKQSSPIRCWTAACYAKENECQRLAGIGCTERLIVCVRARSPPKLDRVVIADKGTSGPARGALIVGAANGDRIGNRGVVVEVNTT